MAYNGAAGSTKLAMATTLEVAGLTDEEINEAYQGLMKLLTDLDPQVRFQIANSIWYRQGLQVEQDFIDVNQRYFDAEVRSVDFNSADATWTINTWVADKTNGNIDKIIDDIPVDVVLYLINAIYFKGTWTSQFDPDDTYDGRFTREDGSEVPCMLMYIKSDFNVFTNEIVTAVDLPYGKGDFSMTVLLPNRGSEIPDVIDGLTNETWDAWTSEFSETETSIILPKFKVEYEKSLNNVLKALGMEIAFTPEADFTEIRRMGGLSIDEVQHKTFVEVNEEGTEAAAVTSVDFFESFPSTISLTRPFVYVIRDRHSGTILFLGTMMDPPQGD
jgi:serine protease inhibitor